MPTTHPYKVLEEFEINGQLLTVGSEVDLTEDVAMAYASKVELVEPPSDPLAGDPPKKKGGRPKKKVEAPVVPETPAPAPALEPATRPADPTDPPAEKKSWYGNHT